MMVKLTSSMLDTVVETGVGNWVEKIMTAGLPVATVANIVSAAQTVAMDEIKELDDLRLAIEIFTHELKPLVDDLSSSHKFSGEEGHRALITMIAMTVPKENLVARVYKIRHGG